ncbi:CLUMA_CG007086, isoform A [Clunio marinus]|uniref:CLUMA_CG007086, isoform A n=1 Tax=Clunio marinus TaxID=568069 RepID=A0A1J1I599_9DIPT|nr:CLUMA_CG007086, isoform A [Clunio marinus]
MSGKKTLVKWIPMVVGFCVFHDDFPYVYNSSFSTLSSSPKTICSCRDFDALPKKLEGKQSEVKPKE